MDFAFFFYLFRFIVRLCRFVSPVSRPALVSTGRAPNDWPRDNVVDAATGRPFVVVVIPVSSSQSQWIGLIFPLRLRPVRWLVEEVSSPQTVTILTRGSCSLHSQLVSGIYRWYFLFF